MRSSLPLRVLLGITLLPLPAVVVSLADEDPAHPRSADRKDGRARVHAVPHPIEPSLQKTLAALGAAKRAGPAARVQSLQAELGWESPRGQDARARSGFPPGWERVVRTDRGERGSKWDYDVLVTQPALPSGNPALACQYQGMLYTIVEDLDSDRLPFYLSDNEGATWAYGFSIHHGAEATNPSIVITEGESHRLLLAYECARGTPTAAIYVYWEDLDYGDYGLWMIASGSTVSRPRICVDSPDTFHWHPYLTFVRGVITDETERYDVCFTRSLDLGTSWQDPITLATDVSAEEFPDIDFGGTNLYVTYSRTNAPDDRDVYVRRSTTWGSSWDEEVLLGSGADDEYDPCVAATNGGDAVVVAYTRELWSGNKYIDVYTSRNAGDSWDYGYLPASPGRDASHVDMVVNGGLGKIHAAFLDDQDVYYSSANHTSPGNWSPLELVNDKHAAVLGSRPSIAINPNKPIEECLVWMDERVYGQQHVYFDAAYPIGDYRIILGQQAFRDELEPFIQWKESLGYRVIVKTVPEILSQFPAEDHAESIWLYLERERFETRYVLLVGQVDTIPMRFLYLDGDIGDGRAFGSDFYYAVLESNSWDEDGDGRWGEPTDDNVSLIPDVLVGRVPISTPAWLSNFAENVVAAEQDAGTWKRNVLLAHGFYNHTEAYQPPADDALVAERIVNDWLTPNNWNSVQLYEKAGIDTSYFLCHYPLNEENFIRERGPGRVGVVSAAAHGCWTGLTSYLWREDVNHNGFADPKEPHSEYGRTDFSQFGNIGLNATSAVVLQIGCETGVVFDRDPTFAYTGLRSRHLIRSPSGDMSLRAYLAHGAPAGIGSSAGSDYKTMWLGPAVGGTESLDYYFFEYLVHRGLRTGDAFQLALLRHASEHNPQRGVRDFNFFGDPSYEVNGTGSRRWNSTGLPVEVFRQGTGHLTAEGTPRTRGVPESGSSDGKERPSRDEGMTWWQAGEIPDAMQIGTIIQASDGSLLAGTDLDHEIVGHMGHIFRSFDQGQSWIPLGELPFCWSVSALLETAGGSLLACGLARSEETWYGILYRSSDGGLQWDIVAAYEDGMIFDIAQAPDGTLWSCGGWDGWIFRSIDDGISWEATASVGAGTHPYSILPCSTGRLFAAMGGPGVASALAYSDDGFTWHFPILGTGLSAAYDLMEWDGLLFAGAAWDGGGAVCAADLNGEVWLLVYTPADPRIRAVRTLCTDRDGYIFAGGEMERGPSETLVYARDPVTGLWDVFGGDLDLANYVRTLCPTANMLYAGTGELHGRLYKHLLPMGSAVEEGSAAPGPLAVRVCPNPSVGRAEIRCALPSPAPLVLRIYDLSGRLVRTMRDEGLAHAGTRLLIWDGRDRAGRRLPAGVYPYQAISGRSRQSGQLIMLR